MCRRALHGHSRPVERGGGTVRGIKRHVPTCSLALVLASLVAAAIMLWSGSRSGASTSGRALGQPPSGVISMSESRPASVTPGFQTRAAALAHRRNLRHADQSLASPHPKRRVQSGDVRRGQRHQRPSSSEARHASHRNLADLIQQALKPSF